MILRQLGVYGWPEADENLVLASLLTGDPLLMIGNHGCAKTHVANKVAQALGRKFLVYDASKCMFEDILGYPNIEKLKHGVVEYVPSPVTIWDKELVLIDELNRAVAELQSKWLEIIRSRKIMGFPTEVKWVWAAMNPMSYSSTNALDAALIGRFSFFVYPMDVLQMDEEDRIKVTTHINGDDAPSLSEWTGGEKAGTVSVTDVQKVGDKLRETLTLAGTYFLRLREQMTTLPEFLSKFSDLLARETSGEVSLDGRRLGFICRNLIANRAVEMAKTDVFGSALPDFVGSARYVVQSSIPVGLNDDGLKREEAVHKMEVCFDLLSSYFDEGAELTRVNLIYELFTTHDIMRRAELLLTEDLGEMALSKAWTDLMAEDRDITLLAYTALQIEARRPDTVPAELLASLTGRIRSENLSTKCVSNLKDADIEYVDEIESMVARHSDLERLVALKHVSRLVSSGGISQEKLRDAQAAIDDDIQRFTLLLDTDAEGEKGDVAA